MIPLGRNLGLHRVRRILGNRPCHARDKSSFERYCPSREYAECAVGVQDLVQLCRTVKFPAIPARNINGTDLESRIGEVVSLLIRRMSPNHRAQIHCGYTYLRA